MEKKIKQIRIPEDELFKHSKNGIIKNFNMCTVKKIWKPIFSLYFANKKRFRKKNLRIWNPWKAIMLRDHIWEILDPHFFHISNQPGPLTDQRVIIFLFLVSFLPSYSNFYESPRGMILRRVNLPGVSYPGESNDFSRSYLKGQSNKIFDMFFS